MASLKDTIAKRDEELEQLQKANVDSMMQGMNSQRYRSCSPRMYSVGTPRQIHRLSKVKGLGTTEKAASETDLFLEYSDKYSDAGSQQSVNEFQHHKEFSCHSNVGEVSSEDLTEDLELLGSGGVYDESLSDRFDGLSMETENEGSTGSFMEYNQFPIVTKAGKTMKAENAQAKDIKAEKTQSQNIQAEKMKDQSIQLKITQAQNLQTEKSQAHNITAENIRKIQSEISDK